MKRCAWDGEALSEEAGSVETREFVPYGKLCLYFCNKQCEGLYNEDAQARGQPLYFIGQRGSE